MEFDEEETCFIIMERLRNSIQGCQKQQAQDYNQEKCSGMPI